MAEQNQGTHLELLFVQGLPALRLLVAESAELREPFKKLYVGGMDKAVLEDCVPKALERERERERERHLLRPKFNYMLFRYMES